MKYGKPQITAIGAALSAIQGLKLRSQYTDAMFLYNFFTLAAYDADE